MKMFLYGLFEFLAILAIPINSIQFLIFSLLGINYDPEEGTGLVALLNVSFCLYSIIWVIKQELQYRTNNKIFFPYIFPFFVILLFFIDSFIYGGMSFNSPSGRQLIFFGTAGIPAIYLATFIYRHNRFDLISKYSDLIMLICTVSLILNLPNMYSGKYGSVAIGGGGNHQNISYSAAFCFCINWINILSNNKIGRLKFTNSSIYKYISYVFLLVQPLICLLGQGRGGAVLLIVSFVSGLFIYSKKKFKKTLFVSTISIIILMIIIKIGDLDSSIGRSFNFISEGSINMDADEERGNLYSCAYKLISENYFFGVGLWHELDVTGIYLHNIFLDILVSGGIFYLFFSLFILKKTYSHALYIIKTDSSKSMLLPWGLYPAVLLMFSGYYPSNSYFWFFVVYCLLYGKRKIN